VPPTPFHTSVVRAGALAGFEELVRQAGADPVPILGAGALRPGDLADPDRYISHRSAVLVLEEAAQALDMPDFGLRLCASQDLSFMGMLALVMQSAPTVREGMLLGGKYSHFHAPGLVFRPFQDTQAGLECVEVFARRSDLPCSPQATEHAVGHLCRLMALLSDHALRPSAIHLRHAPVGSARQYLHHLRQPPRFHAAFDGIAIDPLAWRRPMPRHNHLLGQFVQRFLLGLMPSRERTVVEQAEEVLRGLTRAGMADLARVAQALGLHPRTLQRRLQAEGVRFGELLDAQRKAWAGELMVQRSLPLADIAQLLGFADQSVLTRACRRWFGATPRQLRGQAG
jgi:AraC-like DNA-binding protein